MCVWTASENKKNQRSPNESNLLMSLLYGIFWFNFYFILEVKAFSPPQQSATKSNHNKIMSETTKKYKTKII